MAKLSSGQEIQKRLVENITLLWTLCEIPGQPKENQLGKGHDEGRQLPQDRERQLVDSFAFISASTDDMHRVIAVCIEEDPDKNGMTVRLASNTGDLSHVTQGFNGIARTLEQASLRKLSRIDIQQDVFRQIVTLDEPRILSRLRSNHAKKSPKTRGKPELLPLLNKTVHDESIFGRNKTSTALITSIRSISKGLLQRFSAFEEARGRDCPINVSQNILLELLVHIANFDVDGLEKVLSMSPTTSPPIDPSLKAYLPRAMGKIGRYYGIACDLVNAARSPEYAIFRRISVQPVEKPHFDMAFMADHSAGFDQVAQRVTHRSHRHLLSTYASQSISAARTKFESRMSNRSIPWKVHAEIQILFFYEQQPHVSRPRSIGSSKSACYLCDLFIRLHGTFCVSRTHGRLYDRWILPEQSVNEPATNRHLLSVIDRFNAALEAKITHTLRNRAQPLPHPNESVLLLRQHWPSNSTLAEPHEQASTPELVDPIPESSSSDQTEPHSNTLDQPSSYPTTSISRNQSIAQPYVDNVQPDVYPTQPTKVSRRLSLGESVIHKLLTPQDILVIETGPARLHASWGSITFSRGNDHSPSPRTCWINVQYLSIGDSPAALNDTSFESVDIDSLDEGRDTVVEGGAALSEKKLAIRIRGHLVVIKYTFEGVG